MTKMTQRQRIQKSATSLSKLGYTIFRLGGKTPLKGETKADWCYLMPDDVQEMMGAHTRNFGILLDAEDLIIDVDPRNFLEDDNPLERLVSDAGLDLRASTTAIQTGSGGLHFFFKKPKDAFISKNPKLNKSELYPGIDFLSKGQYVVGVESIHPDTQKPYSFVKGYQKFSKIEQAPIDLLNLIKKKPKEKSEKPKGKIVCQDENEETLERFIEYLGKATPAVEGSSGDGTTYGVACRAQDLAISESKAVELILEHYNPRCSPPWSHDDIVKKVSNAYEYAQSDSGEALAEYDFPESETEGEEIDTGKGEKRVIRWDKAQRFPFDRLKTLNNTLNIMYLAKSDKGQFYFRDNLTRNEFTNKVFYTKPMPWDKGRMPGRESEGEEWQDDYTTRLKAFMSTKYRFDIATSTIEEALTEMMRQNSIHPLKENLNKLKAEWDGVERIDTYLIKYAGAKDNPYVRAVSRKTLLQAVSRIFRPGCKADHVLVIEGSQGVGKSTLVEMLAMGTHVGLVIDLRNKDIIDNMMGRWIIELPELVGFDRANSDQLKAFISNRKDVTRLAYGRRTIDLPRQCVFIGTYNPDASGEYLTDQTGNRRWWPVTTGQLSFDSFEEIVPQLWGEAVNAYMDGEETHITDPEVLKMCTEEQNRRQVTDPWMESVEEFLKSLRRPYTTTKEVWEYLGGDNLKFGNRQAKRVSSALKKAGWDRKKIRPEDGSRPVNAFVKPGFTGHELPLPGTPEDDFGNDNCEELFG